MSKIKSLDKNLYPSIYDAIYEIMDEHLLVAGDASIYDGRALEEVCFFLAENNIQHQYITLPSYSPEYDQVVSLTWAEPGAMGNEVWYSRGEAFAKKHYRVSVLVAADNEDEVENWITTLSEIDVCDWSIDEV